jgi:hypothetical protein
LVYHWLFNFHDFQEDSKPGLDLDSAADFLGMWELVDRHGFQAVAIPV